MMPSTTKTTNIIGEYIDFWGNSHETVARTSRTDRTTNVTIGYFRKKKLHQRLAPLNYVVDRSIFDYGYGSLNSYFTSTGLPAYSESGCMRHAQVALSDFGDIHQQNWSLIDSASLDNRLSQKVLDGLKGQRIDLGEAFGERSQTVRMLEQSIGKLVKGARALRRGDLAQFAQALDLSHVTSKRAAKYRNHRAARGKKDAFADYWLEYTYGWKPFISDIYSAMEIFSKPIDDKPHAEIKRSVFHAYPDINVRQNSTFRHVTGCVTTVRKQLHIYYTLSGTESDVFVRSLSQLGLTNPLELAWNLMPYSFVIDWLLPVGNYLNALDATFGLTFLSGYRNDRWFSWSKRSTTGVGNTGTTFTYYTGGAADSFRRDYFSRNIVTSFPSPVVPTLQNPLSVNRAVTSLALLNQIFKKW
jgi:hypothetical protein